MDKLGIDLGASTVKLVLMEGNQLRKTWSATHYGNLMPTLKKGLLVIQEELKVDAASDQIAIMVTGSNAQTLLSHISEIVYLSDIPAITEGIRFLAPMAESIIEIGSQSARYITELQKGAPRFSVNEHCAGGTGSFFEDQMTRLGLPLEDYSALCEQATSIPRLSGRCAVFAKTDIIHRQQEGIPTPDILLGLCYAMIRNYKATIVRNLPIKRPLVFCGGVTQNTGVLRAIREVFELSSEEFIVPKEALFVTAIGAAVKAEKEISFCQLLNTLHKASVLGSRPATLPALSLPSDTNLQDPIPTRMIPTRGCALGIDIGSTSTNLVLTDETGALIDYQYLRTAGDPEAAVRKGLSNIRNRFGEISFRAVGVTGSGRERLGRMLGADAVRDEITAQAKAATHWVPEADTVFEIGGQDSKYISLQNGQVTDFQMNKICAAGTGSFIEEQASRMNIPIQDFGDLALSATAPVELGERCTVFIETAIASAMASQVSKADIAAGLCHAVVRNYLHKVVGSKPVGEHIVLQGGVAYNPGIVAAFRQTYGNHITVSPCFSVSGAFGAALLALETMSDKESCFKGFDFPGGDSPEFHFSEEVNKNVNFYQKSGKLLLEDYDGTLDANKPTVGVPYVLVIHKFFPMVNAFFKSLGFNVLLTDPTNEETIRLAQQYASGETCYPVKLIWGHMAQLVAKKVDYIFLPSVHTMKHESSHVEHNYGCVYMQSAPHIVARGLRLKEQGIELLSPVFDLDFGKEAMATAMISIGKKLGIPKPLCMKALLSGSMAVRKHTAQVEKQGQRLLSSLKPEDKVLVLITRNYGISDPVLNMGIPQLLLERGHKVITLSHLPAHDLDISKDHPNLYWPFGQHIISGMKMVANHPNLYAVYLTNHGCGPDSMLSHLVRQEMGDKPYLQIEVDEHFSSVGVITRIEAFLNALSHRPAQPLPKDFNLKNVNCYPSKISAKTFTNQPLYLPDMGWYTPYLLDYFHKIGMPAYSCGELTRETLALGRAETNSKEYLPFPALLGSILTVLEEKKTTSNEAMPQFLVPFTHGAEADGQYAQAIRVILDRKGYHEPGIFSPMLETLPLTASDPELLFRALLTGDLLYSAPSEVRTALAPTDIPDYGTLLALAHRISELPITGRKIAGIGTPLCLTSLNEGALDALEQEGNTILRAPLSEYLWFLWRDNTEDKNTLSHLEDFRQKMTSLGSALGERNSFSINAISLLTLADQHLPAFNGGNGRYRWAKVMEMGNTSQAVLTLAPRYENTAMVLELLGLHDFCPAPLFSLAIDGDWDETARVKLKSFLYYC